MNSYVITITSQQTLGNPDQLNHYLFSDPVFGYNFTYPLTTNGGEPWLPANTLVDGGLFFPWGYTFQTSYQFISAGIFKGPYTITFSPSGLDTSYYGILKIVYDLGDGTVRLVERDIIPNNPDTANITGNPANINVSHEYWPQNTGITTYTPSITVVNGNLSLDVYVFDIKLVPSTIHEFDEFKLINVAQHKEAKDETLGIFEFVRPDRYVTTARFFSGGDTGYNINLPYFDFLNDPSLILNLDASDALTIIKNSTNKVSYWYDKTIYKNDFAQGVIPYRPVFQYNTGPSPRKAVRFFTDVNYTPSMTCINPTGFSSISGGFTLCMVMRGATPGGSLYSFTSAGSLSSLADTEISQVLMYNRPLTVEQREVVIQGLDTKWNNPN